MDKGHGDCDGLQQQVYEYLINISVPIAPAGETKLKPFDSPSIPLHSLHLSLSLSLSHLQERTTSRESTRRSGETTAWRLGEWTRKFLGRTTRGEWKGCTRKEGNKKEREREGEREAWEGEETVRSAKSQTTAWFASPSFACGHIFSISFPFLLSLVRAVVPLLLFFLPFVV